MSFEGIVSTVSSPALLLALVFVYAIVVAAVLPFPSEAVLVVPLVLGYPWYVSFPLVIFVAAAGNAVGSCITLRVGYSVSRSGPIVRLFERSATYRRFKHEALAGFVRRYRYLGLAIAISIPLLPETTTLYAFSVLDNRPVLFAATAFVGTVVRLCIVLLVVGGALTVGG